MEIPLLDTIDLEIFMHRDAHFGRNFSIMLDYYKNDGVGVMPDFSISRIEALKKLQDDRGQDLSLELLPLPAAEQVKKSLEYYHKFKEVYEGKEKLPILISDLILSEEDDPEKEISALVKYGAKAVDALINILDSNDFYNELFPGYGRAPALAAKCLGKIGDKKALYPLFASLGRANFYVDDSIIQALVSFNEVGKEFLLKGLSGKPITSDNVNAAVALSSYPLDEEIAKSALSMLSKINLKEHINFASYLICMCEGLSSEEERLAFFNLAVDKNLENEKKMILKIWGFKV